MAGSSGVLPSLPAEPALQELKDCGAGGMCKLQELKDMEAGNNLPPTYKPTHLAPRPSDNLFYKEQLDPLQAQRAWNSGNNRAITY